MRKVSVDELESAMILARDVEDYTGFRILGKATVLTERQIALLRSWGVIDVWVEDELAKPEGLEVALSAEEVALEAAKARLKKRFKGRLENEYMKTIYREAEKRLTVPRFWKTQM